MEHLLPFPFPSREDDPLLSLLGIVEPVRGQKPRCAGQCTSKQGGDRQGSTPLSTSFLLSWWSLGRLGGRDRGRAATLLTCRESHSDTWVMLEKAIGETSKVALLARAISHDAV